MFSRKNRLKDRRVFAKIRERGVRRNDEHLLVRAVKIGHGPVKFAVIMSTKAAKLATERNWHKRIIRDEIRSLVSSLPVGWNFTITIRKAVRMGEDAEVLREEIRKLFAGPFSG